MAYKITGDFGSSVIGTPDETVALKIDETIVEIAIRGIAVHKGKIFILSKNGFSLAGIGAASWAFEKTNEGWNPTTTTPLGDEDVSKLELLVDELDRVRAGHDA